ncbi:patatin-like phospholipase family protein [Chromobacterium paludis]|uniref:Patatin-like phospholipase family protein n=1 Tax=Chromobacterium paludis TaxID=2605945 RepID=A0A5C1DJH6_9NEIS|nr:patatin-like phospholipase family protein [Chromobacterium paludis]QEL56830.1 patatin-like phospholipase family protein [Chromobacterium paludis]
MALEKRNPACHADAGIHCSPALPPDHRYQVVALVLQGGGALGAYQAGVYQGLAEAELHPNWVAGISIGALNAAVIAGNPPEQRAERLQQFWSTISRQPLLPPSPHNLVDAEWPPALQGWLNGLEAWRALIEGQNGFFVPRSPLRAPAGGTASFYDTAPLKSTLERLVDFDRLNDSGEMRVSVGAVNVKSGNFVYFDNTRQRLRPEHFMASGALPPGFPAVEIDGEHYWDGGMVSNTPLQQVLTARPRKHSLVFQVDLWNARGALPEDLSTVALRQKDIQFSSRTRMITGYMKETQQFRQMLREVMELVPEAQRDAPAYRRAAEQACDRLFNVLHLIYQDKPCEGHYKDYQFSARAMREHWDSGLADIRSSLAHPEWLRMPQPDQPFVSHDVHRPG